MHLGLELFYQAFIDLHTCRNGGFGEGQISWLSISDYCERLNIVGDQKEDLIYHVRAMDHAYLKHMDKNRGKK